jgi:molybdopterin-guanine dinucleotide biosynthesis protein A
MSSKPKKNSQADNHISGITGVILAGGKSSRFGKNKALVEINGTPLIERVVHIMAKIFQNIIISSNTPHEYEYLGLPIYKDIIVDLGPIGGIYTGLKVIKDDVGFFVACDMPFLNENLIRYMAGLRGGSDIVIPRVDWMIEALHAIYTKKCLPQIEKQVHLGIYHPRQLLEVMNVKYIDEAKLRSFDPHLDAFINVNRPSELSKIKKLQETL